MLDEIAKGIERYPVLGGIAGLPWLRSVEIDLAELAAFATYKGALGGAADENVGESAVLAWVAAHGGTAIVDDEVARNMGLDDGLEVHGTLWLVVRAYKHDVLDRPTATAIVDDLIMSEMRLPFTGGASLFGWAYEQGYLP